MLDESMRTTVTLDSELPAKVRALHRTLRLAGKLEGAEPIRKLELRK